MGELPGLLTDLHTRIHNAVTIALAGIGENPSGLPAALALAFALGMVHALMPGHGKTVVFSYFLGAQARIGAGVTMAAKIALLHVGTAILLLLVVGAAVVRMGRLQGAGRVMEMVSYAAVRRSAPGCCGARCAAGPRASTAMTGGRPARLAGRSASCPAR